jgi:hypothetical protein
MSLKAIITTIVLGTSSIAAADTTFYAQGSLQGSVNVRDHRAPAPVYQAPVYQAPAPVYQAPVYQAPAPVYQAPRPMYPFRKPVYTRPALQPITLASSLRVQGRDVISVADSLRAFTKLELRATNGHTNLDKVLITFGNGQTQTIDCNRKLNGSESFSIDLAGNQRNIKKIVVVGKSGRRASIDVIAV